MDQIKITYKSLAAMDGIGQMDLLTLIIGTRKQKRIIWRKIHYLLKKQGYFKTHCERCFLREHANRIIY